MGGNHFVFAFSLLVVFTQPKILDMDGNTLKATLKNYSIVLVQFYAKWCSFCHEFEHNFEKVAKALIVANANVQVRKINGERHISLMSLYKIKAYPSFILFLDSHPFIFDQEITPDILLQWVKETIAREPGLILNRDSLKSLKQNYDLVHVYVGLERGRRYNTVKLMVKRIGDIPIFVINSLELKDELGLEDHSFYSVSLKEGVKTKYEGIFEEDLLYRFVYITHQGQFLDFTQDILFNNLSKRIPTLCLFLESASDPILKRRSQLKEGFGSHISAIVLSHKLSKEEKSTWRLCGMGQKRRGACIIEREGEVITYILKKRLTFDNLDTFLESYLTGNLEPEILNEHLTGSRMNGIIKILNSELFTNLLNSKTYKAKLILLFEEDCPACNTIFRILNSLKTNKAIAKRVTFSQINISRNEIMNLQVEEFPCLAMLKSEKQDKMSQSYIYQGKWENETIREWILSILYYQSEDTEDLEIDL